MTVERAHDLARIGAIFDIVAELTPETAARRLEIECEGDSELRDAVTKLLAHDHAADAGFLSRLPADPSLAAGQSTAGPWPVATPGASSQLGRYYVLHKLGEGGMGAVFAGYDERLDRRVALKILRRSAGREWLLREGQALGRLSHPNVVAIHEVSEHEGQPFLAMEFVEGQTLRGWLEESPRSVSDTLRMFMQAARGLAAIHRAGLVHRDFKPDNVLIGRDGRARVADLGIAALAGTRVEPGLEPGPSPQPTLLATPLTQTGALIGTPSFMAPEQFDGARATPASDQWSFAVALYRAVYGTSPYPGGNAVSLALQVRAQPPAVPVRRPDVPVWLWPILQRALERDPGRRFASMDELLAQIMTQLPRDPDLDPTVVAHERTRLSALYMVACCCTWGPMVWAPSRALWLTPAALVIALVVFSTLMWTAAALRWHVLGQNTYGRRIGLGFPMIVTVLLIGRVVGLMMHQPASVIIVSELVSLGAFLASLAVFMAPWTGWMSGAVMLIALAGARFPEAAPVLAGWGALACVVGGLFRLYVDRLLNPNAAVVASRDEDTVDGAAGSP